MMLVAITAGFLLLGHPGHPVEHQDPEQMADVLDRLDEVEKKSLLDRANLTGEYRTILNSYIVNQPGKNVVSPEVWSHRLRLLVDADPTDNIRVTARLAMFKIFGDNSNPVGLTDFNLSQKPGDSGVKVEQVWVDWFITEWLTISAGRLAATEGPPEDLKNNTSFRQSTWGTHMIDGEYDSINITFRIPDSSTYLRLIYSSQYFDNDAGLPFLEDRDNLRVFGANFETTIPKIGPNSLQLSVVGTPQVSPFTIPLPLDLVLDPTQPSNPEANALYPAPDGYPDTLGWFVRVGALVMFYDIAETGLDFFLAGGFSISESSGKGISYPNVLGNFNPQTNQFESVPLVYLVGAGEKSGPSSFLYTGMRYKLPLDSLYAPKLGLEFNYNLKI